LYMTQFWVSLHLEVYNSSSTDFGSIHSTMSSRVRSSMSLGRYPSITSSTPFCHRWRLVSWISSSRLACWTGTLSCT
jgi:hypothetical protein